MSAELQATGGDAVADVIESGEVLNQVRAALRGLQFGDVTVLVHNGSVVRIERTEKRRYRFRSRDDGHLG